MGREREGKGKIKEKERERKGKVKVITLIPAVLVRLETVSKYRNKPKQTERGDYILSEKIPKQNQNCQCFGLFRFEPKEKKIGFAGHPTPDLPALFVSSLILLYFFSADNSY
jgi:hypothetical protein